MADAADSFDDKLADAGLNRGNLQPIIDHVNENSHHPDFEEDYNAVSGGGNPRDVRIFLTRVFGDIYRLGDYKRLQLSHRHFAEHNCEVEEAIEELLSWTDWERAQYDICEDIILSFCESHQANRDKTKLTKFVQDNRAEDWNSLGENEEEIWKTVESIFGYPNFFLQQGPREAVLAVHQERNDHEEMFKPLDDFDDLAKFPRHEDGFLLAKAYGGQTTVMKHTVDGKLLVSKEIPGNFDELIEFSDDFPPNEVATNRTIQDYFANLAPDIDKGCPFIIEMVGVTKEDTDAGCSYFYYMEGGDSLFEWVGSEWENQKKSWMSKLKAKEANWKKHKSPYHQEVTRYFVQILAAVQYMHMLKIAHRDLKLENVILVGPRDGLRCAKLIDFGIAHRFGAGEQPKALDAVGTYQSPECIQEGSYDAFKNDVWALGFMLYMMIAREPPYEFASNSDPGFRSCTNGSYVEGDANPKETIKKWLKKRDALFLFTPKTLDLLENIFCPEENRYTIQEVFEHEWCEEEVQGMYAAGELSCINSFLKKVLES